MFVVQNRIFRDTGTQLFKPLKTRTNSIPNKDRVYRLLNAFVDYETQVLQYKAIANSPCIGHINRCGQC
jgi:hypothetical protein